ncbi:hypothetical protein YC2023_009336 [Brassica napus]
MFLNRKINSNRFCAVGNFFLLDCAAETLYAVRLCCWLDYKPTWFPYTISLLRLLAHHVFDLIPKSEAHVFFCNTFVLSFFWSCSINNL